MAGYVGVAPGTTTLFIPARPREEAPLGEACGPDNVWPYITPPYMVAGPGNTAFPNPPLVTFQVTSPSTWTPPAASGGAGGGDAATPTMTRPRQTRPPRELTPIGPTQTPVLNPALIQDRPLPGTQQPTMTYTPPTLPPRELTLPGLTTTLPPLATLPPLTSNIQTQAFVNMLPPTANMLAPIAPTIATRPPQAFVDTLPATANMLAPTAPVRLTQAFVDTLPATANMLAPAPAPIYSPIVTKAAPTALTQPVTVLSPQMWTPTEATLAPTAPAPTAPAPIKSVPVIMQPAPVTVQPAAEPVKQVLSPQMWAPATSPTSAPVSTKTLVTGPTVLAPIALIAPTPIAPAPIAPAPTTLTSLLTSVFKKTKPLTGIPHLPSERTPTPQWVGPPIPRPTTPGHGGGGGFPAASVATRLARGYVTPYADEIELKGIGTSWSTWLTTVAVVGLGVGVGVSLHRYRTTKPLKGAARRRKR